MSWSKVNNKTKKPLKWWFHKVLCEIGWLIRNKDNWTMYYKHLNILCKQGFNLYGNEI